MEQAQQKSAAPSHDSMVLLSNAPCSVLQVRMGQATLIAAHLAA
jgi:hypothetical protein